MLACLPWMQVKHPVDPVQQALIAEGETTSRAVRPLAAAAQAAALLAYAGYATVRLVALRWRLRRHLSALRRRTFDLVAKTWSFGADPPPGADDFYYGSLQHRLAERGVRLLLLSGDARGSWRHAPTASPSHLSELCLVPLWAPLAVAFQQMGTWARLVPLATRETRPLVRRVARRALDECLSRHISAAGLHHRIAARAVRRWRPRAFLTLYEGHGWERNILRAVKAADPSCLTVGYQHTVIHPNNVALREPAPETLESPRPDVVLCLGTRPQGILQPAHPHARLVAFGTFRSQGHVAKPPRPSARRVLVLPEGRAEEEVPLFDRALEVAALLPDHRFVLRCHPLRGDGAAYIRGLRLRRDPDGLPNVVLAPPGPIEPDFEAASAVMYYASSSVFYAVRYGLKPVHVRDGYGYEVDPLFELTGWREAADSADDVARILRRFAGTDAARADAEWRPTCDYVVSYATPVNDASLDGLLEAVGLAGRGMLR
jgi:hypothetical protein